MLFELLQEELVANRVEEVILAIHDLLIYSSVKLPQLCLQRFYILVS